MAHNTLMRAIIEHVHRGTLIITDKWKGYLHLDKHGYRHEDVNHSRGFVNPTTGAHTNGIEGSWFHAKRHMRRGQGKTRTDSLAMGAALQEYMWLKKQHITRSDADCRRLFSRELPLLFDRIFSWKFNCYVVFDNHLTNVWISITAESHSYQNLVNNY